MTLVASRPIIRVKPVLEEPTRPIALSALIAAGWVVLAGLTTALALAVAAWFAADGGSFGTAVRAGGLGWLVAHGSGITVSGDEVSLVPLGGCLLAGLLLYRAGRWAGATSAVRSLADLGVGATVMVATYTVAGVAVAGLTHRSSAHVGSLRTVVAFAVIAGLFGGLGLVRGSDFGGELAALVPDEARRVASGALAGFLTMSGLSAAVFAVGMARHFSSATSLAGGLDAGLVGGTILALVGVGLVPNAVLCAGAFMAGPGFSLGSGTSVSSTQVDLGPLPGFPILAATPRSGGAWWQEALVVAPLVAGVVAGLVTLRRGPRGSYLLVAGRSAAAGALGGAVFGAAGLLTTGSAGPGRLADVGPEVAATMLVCAVAGLLAAAFAAVGAAWATEGVTVVRRRRVPPSSSS